MEQYIKKSALIAEIEKLRKTSLEYGYTAMSKVLADTGKDLALGQLLHNLDTLEVKEVDLEKTINDYFKDWKFDEELDIMVKPNNYSATFDDIKELAKHFFELGMSVSNKSQKEEIINEICEWIGKQKELLEDSFSDPNDFADILKLEIKN